MICDSQYIENYLQQTQDRNDLVNWLKNLSIFDITSNANVLRCLGCRHEFTIKLTSETFWNKFINATT